ncbi:DIS3 mitotic control, partial [Perkinsus olseni]
MLQRGHSASKAAGLYAAESLPLTVRSVFERVAKFSIFEERQNDVHELSGIQRPVFVRTLSTQPVIAVPPSPGRIATTFEPWWSAEDIEAGLEAGTVRYGRLHVPAFETGQASVELDADDDGRRVRVKVPGFIARNRAVHGDRVAVRLMWRAYKRDDSGSDGTGEDEASVGRVEDARARVVAVVRRSEAPVVGVARPGETKIQPRDQRLPAMDLIHPFSKVDEGVHLVACEIVEWEETSVNPKCKMVHHLGPVGSGVAEHRAIMERYGLTSQEYSEDVERALRGRLPSSEAVVEEVLRGNGPRRWDLRK